jgi:hypothetical protein
MRRLAVLAILAGLQSSVGLQQGRDLSKESKTNVLKSQASKTEVPKTHASKTQASKVKVPKTQGFQFGQASKTESSKTEVPKTQASKSEVPKTQASKTEVPKNQGVQPASKTEESKTEVPKTLASKTEVHEAHASKTHASKTEVLKTQDVQSGQASKNKAPKTEVPKTQASKTKVPRTQGVQPASKTEVSKTEVPTTWGVQSSQASKSEVLKTEASKTEMLKTLASKTEAHKAHASKTHTSKTEVPIRHLGWTNTQNVQSGQASKTEAPKSEVPKTQASKTEVPKTRASKTQASNTEVPETWGVQSSQASKSEVLKGEASKTEVPKTQVSKTEAPKPEVPPRAMLTGQRLNSSNPLNAIRQLLPTNTRPPAPAPLPAEVKGSLVAAESNVSSYERLRRRRAAQRLLTRDDQADQKPRFVAWLISGQVSRFIYKDSTGFIDGGLRAWSGCFGKDGDSCSMSVDVHIALANTHVHQFRGPKYVLPAYEDGAFDESTIEAHYTNFQASGSRQLVSSSEMGEKVALMKDEFKKSGARRVHVKIVSGEQFESNVKRVRELILKRARRSMDPPMKDFDSFWKQLKNHVNRFEQNGNMMYLRHLAYRSAVLAERDLPYNYTHILYTREDNVFVHPSYTLLQLARDLDGPFAPSLSPASVLVDSRCGWLAFSDKLYFASRRGIDILFARTLDDHITQMAKWINMARTSTVFKDPLMTEDYFKRLLVDAHANVTKFDFLRTEVRYREGHPDPCIPDIYRECTSVGEQFETCPVGPGERAAPSSIHGRYR